METQPGDPGTGGGSNPLNHGLEHVRTCWNYKIMSVWGLENNQGIFLVPAPGGRAYIPRGVAIYTWYMPGIYPSVWVEHIPAIYTEVCP